MNTTEDGDEPVGEGPIDTLSGVERLLQGADLILATKQIAEQRGQALAEIRELCDDLIAQGRGHGAAPTRSNVIAATVAESILALIERPAHERICAGCLHHEMSHVHNRDGAPCGEKSCDCDNYHGALA